MKSKLVQCLKDSGISGSKQVHPQSMVQEQLASVVRKRHVTMREIMTYYKPKWMAVGGIISSVVAALQLPCFGFILSQLIFVLQLSPDDPDFVDSRNLWIILFFVLCVCIGLATFS